MSREKTSSLTRPLACAVVLFSTLAYALAGGSGRLMGRALDALPSFSTFTHIVRLKVERYIDTWTDLA